MKKVIAAVFILSLVSCTDDGNSKLTELKVYSGAVVSSDFPFVNNNPSAASERTFVFHYFYQEADEEYIADDEFAEDFLIGVNMTGDEFSLATADLQELSHIYRQHCFCGLVDDTRMTAGSLEGREKSNGDWQVSGQITVELGFVYEQGGEIDWAFDKELTLNGTFRLANIPSQ